MSANTAKAGLTTPSLSDVPNVPANLATLAGQLDGMVIPTYATATAMNTANATPKAGDICYRTDLVAYMMYNGSAWVPASGNAWTSFTPTWTAVTTNPSIVNGTLEGKYIQIGKTVHVRISMVAGSSTTFGSGEWKFALPLTAATLGNSNFGWHGSSIGLRPGTAYNAGIGRIYSGGTFAQVVSPTAADGSTNAAWGAAVPYTWASTHVLSLSITYEVP